MRLLKLLLTLGVVSVAVSLLVTFLSMMTNSFSTELPQGGAIVAISGPGAETVERTARAVELFNQRFAPRLVLSGGTGAAAAMKEQAMAGGVPEDAIRIEDASRSTLQNALFVRDLGIPTDLPLLLVTHRYHLPRARASFRWAGFAEVEPVPADPNGALRVTQNVLMEGIKWPANTARAALASAMMAVDAPRERWIGWLD